MDNPARAPVAAAPAATILLLRDDPFEVLMVRRRSGSFFSSALVFPGGVVDADDSAEDWGPHISGAEDLSPIERALRIAACREAHEETAIAPATNGKILGEPGKGDFLAQVRAHGAVLALDLLCPFAHWITPEMAKKRFDTHFFLCPAPEGAEPVCDADETVSAEWLAPADVVARAEGGETTILFPTLMNLMRLAESSSVEAAVAAARARPRFTVLPRVERRPDGAVVIIPEEAGYGVTEYAAPEVAGPPRQ